MPHFTTEDAAVLRVSSDFDLRSIDPDSTPGFSGKKADAATAFTEHDDEIAELQERMFANARAGHEAPSVLLLLQGMDTSGKGGIVRHVIGGVDPQGVQIASFKAPTAEEREQDFLVRIRKQLPGAGKIGVFDRSHYEDVLIQRVRAFAPPEEIERRYGAIVDFERELADSGTKLIKVMLHISKAEQGARLAERLDRPDKHWKYNPGDVDERLLWDEYQEAYDIALTRTSTEVSPWYCVPANRKWYSRLVVKGLLLDALRGFDLQWPAADFDVEVEKKRLAESA
ncbi:PPK2 family polyphosphate kinase [Pseudoclavibacter helvolus]|uniref:PPK2 family polyphosphate kinase n=1 Tax=Pseudoclavibacter helvolus TaxID=255205 RepID=UPI003C78F934